MGDGDEGATSFWSAATHSESASHVCLSPCAPVSARPCGMSPLSRWGSREINMAVDTRWVRQFVNLAGSNAQRERWPRLLVALHPRFAPVFCPSPLPRWCSWSIAVHLIGAPGRETWRWIRGGYVNLSICLAATRRENAGRVYSSPCIPFCPPSWLPVPVALLVLLEH